MGKTEKSTFVKNLIRSRKALGWTAETLAERADVPYPTVRDIEAGRSNGWVSTREKLAKALSQSIDELNGVTKPAKELTDQHIKAAVVEAVKELFPSEFNSVAPINPDLQKLWAKWDKTPAGLRACALYLITGDEADLKNVHKKIREELKAFRKYVPQIRLPKV